MECSEELSLLRSATAGVQLAIYARQVPFRRPLAQLHVSRASLAVTLTQTGLLSALSASLGQGAVRNTRRRPGPPFTDTRKSYQEKVIFFLRAGRKAKECSNTLFLQVSCLTAFWASELSAVQNLDGRNRAIVIAESLARVIAAIRIASIRWQSYLPRNTEISPHRPCVRNAAIRIARLAFVRLTFVPHGTAEWRARVDRVH